MVLDNFDVRLSMLKGRVSYLLEKANILHPKAIHTDYDVRYMSYEIIVELEERFSLHFSVPRHQMELEVPPEFLHTTALLASHARVVVPSSMASSLVGGKGLVPLAVVGGYAHGTVITTDLAHGFVVVGEEVNAQSFSSLVPDSEARFNTFSYEVRVFVGNGVTGYILCPHGVEVDLDFVLATFEEFPELALLPASQFASVKDCTVLDNHTSNISLRDWNHFA